MITAVQACSRVHNGLTEPGQAAREGGEDNEVQVLGPPRWDNSLRVRHGKKTWEPRSQKTGAKTLRSGDAALPTQNMEILRRRIGASSSDTKHPLYIVEGSVIWLKSLCSFPQ